MSLSLRERLAQNSKPMRENPAFRDAIRINKNDPVEKRMASASHSIVLDLSNLEQKFSAQQEAIKKHELETVPRETVLKMLTNAKMDELFPFKVSSGQGENYIQAMRQVLSRTRKKALRKKVQLDEFKLLQISIEKKDEFDEVTLVRTKTLSEHQESVYDELMKAFAKPPKDGGGNSGAPATPNGAFTPSEIGEIKRGM